MAGLDAHFLGPGTRGICGREGPRRILDLNGQGALDAMSAEKDREPISTVHAQAAMPAGAVFLSYASQDVAAAEQIAAALRAAGIEVWIDKSELRGGDAWDQSIR